MKRKIIFTVLAFCAAAIVSAQGMPGYGRGWGYPLGEALTVTGNLALSQGAIAVTSGGTTYLVPGLQRFVGFIDSLKDGAQVTIEGYAADWQPDGKTKMLRANKLTIGGKDYEVGPSDMNRQMMPGYGGFGGHRGGGWQGCGRGGRW